MDKEAKELLQAILRNQHSMMVALAKLNEESRAGAGGYIADKLRNRVRDLERKFDWIASSNDKIDVR